MFTFKKAEKKQIKVKLATIGPSGSGKTFSSLRLAKGLGKRVAVIDTENGSASLYADKFEFDVMEITPPFTVDKYVGAIEAAVKAKFDVLVIDSLSHVWAGEGGLLEQKEMLDSRPNSNSFSNWGKITKAHEALKSKILHSDIHIVATMRSKQDYVQEKNEKTGKMGVKKLGLAPVQRDGLEYEFAVVFEIGVDHMAQATKDRTGLFTSVNDQKIFTVTEETGEAIRSWLQSGKVVDVPVSLDPTTLQMPEANVNATGGDGDGVRHSTSHPVSLDNEKRIKEIKAKNGWSGVDIGDYIQLRFNKARVSELTSDEFEKLIQIMDIQTPSTAKEMQRAMKGKTAPETKPGDFQYDGDLVL